MSFNPLYLQMSQVHPPSVEDLRAKRRQFEIVRQELRIRKVLKKLAGEISSPQEKHKLYRLYYAAITYLGPRVRSLRMRRDRTSRSQLVEAEEWLETLKDEYFSDTGEEWSDVREEGPIILTTNPVTGGEISSELTDIVKQLKSNGAMRYFYMSGHRYNLMLSISVKLGRSCTSQEPTEMRRESPD